MKWIGAAWAKGALDEFDPLFEAEMTPQEFKETFIAYFENNFNAGWTFFADTGEEVRPIGFSVAWMRGRIVEIGAIVWFPWASRRNILESAVNFFDALRKDVWDKDREVGDPLRYYKVLEFAHMKDNKFFLQIAKKGILRRVGHVNDLYPDSPAVLFETKSPLK